MSIRISFLSSLLLGSLVGLCVKANPASPVESAKTDQAQVRAEKLKAPYGSHLEPILQKIGATPEQRKRIAEIVMSHKPRIEPLRQEYKQKSQEFLTCLVSRKPAEDIMASQGELSQLYSVIVSQYNLMRLEIRRLLTPEQRVVFEEYRRQQGWSSH
ncbi:MAG: hypothetical protein HY711_08035 [Candidatus Melainabacteria bacterium]|nr:hypothetical protein [Candidatus Melainabacteria bacterium]